MCSNSCRSCLFEHETIEIDQSSHKMYSNNILNFQESTTILNACKKKSGNLLNASRIYLSICLKKTRNLEIRDLRRLAVTQSPVTDL